MDTKTFADAVTRSAMAARIGVGLTAISNGVTSGKFPASWFVVLKQLASEVGVDCPLCLFGFLNSATDNQHGHAVDPLHPSDLEQTVSKKDDPSGPFVAAR